MPGLSTTSEALVLNGVGGNPAASWPTSLWIGLHTAVGIDSGSGFTEVTGGSYARVQIAGQLTISATQGALGTTLTFASVPSWVVPGMVVVNRTRADIPTNTTVVSTTSTTVVLSASTVTTVATSGDVIQFSIFHPPATGEPSSITSSAPVTFPQATAGWGTVIAWGIFDAASAGTQWFWDYLGNYDWLPVYITNANPAVWTVKAHGYFQGDSFIYSNELINGQGLPTFSAGNFVVSGIVGGVSPTLTVNTVLGTDTFSALNSATGIATTSSGTGMVRKIIPQIVAITAQPVFAANQFTILGG